jgi:hypothetical protein
MRASATRTIVSLPPVAMTAGHAIGGIAPAELRGLKLPAGSTGSKADQGRRAEPPRAYPILCPAVQAYWLGHCETARLALEDVQVLGERPADYVDQRHRMSEDGERLFCAL